MVQGGQDTEQQAEACHDDHQRSVFIAIADVTGIDPLTLMLRFVYWADSPDNLFPSIHCLESYVLTRGAFKMERCPAWFKWGSIPVTLLVFASTLFTRQHVFVDIIAAVAVVEIGYLISGRFFKCSKVSKN